MDRRALAQHTGGGESGRPTDQIIPPGLPGFEGSAIYQNWFYDNADPANYINAPFGRGSPNVRMFSDPELDRRMAETARFSGEQRSQAYAELDRDLAGRFAATAPFATGASSYFLSSRMGCAKLHPIYGLDLTALCIRKSG